MGEIRMLCEEGDVKITWNPDKPEEVKNAKEMFLRLKEKGHIFFKVSKTKKKRKWGLIGKEVVKTEKGERVRWFGEADGELLVEFDEKAEKIVAAPVVTGG